MAAAYDLDFHAWTLAQADALRRRSANEVDWENVAEEMESLGKQQVAELRSRLEVLLVHLLKWAWQPERRGRSWSNTIREQRSRVLRHVGDNPSLKPVLPTTFVEAYEDARFQASTEMDIDVDLLPEQSPFTLAQARDEAFWPEPVTADAPRG